MIYVGAFIAIQFIIVTAILLYRNHNPQGVLLIMGILMMTIGLFIGLENVDVAGTTGLVAFDLFKKIEETFTSNLMNVGFMIMTIGGYVDYMKRIKASDALVYVSMQPLSLFKKFPYIAAISIIPIGQILFISIPSATGLGLLLVASIMPVLIRIGVSKLTAVSVITACTVFDMGPSSANTLRASELSELNSISYFLEYQLPIVIPMTIVLMLLYYITSRYYDKKDAAKKPAQTEKVVHENFDVDVPLIYAVLPLLPIVLLIVFSRYLQLFNPPIELNTTTAMIISLFVAIIFELIRVKSITKMFENLKYFWEGMGKVFASVVTLIVSAEIFSNGLISLGFIEALVQGSTHLGFSGAVIGVIIAIIIFLAATLMGSGNASFFSFGPLIPGIAQRFGMVPVDMVLPMQLSASMGRATSPIAGVVIATAEIAGVSTFELAKRNMIPLGGTLLFMLIYNQLFL
ncbi:MAG TPA: C4-dicarboxylate ABC transporter [Porphyromonadaceae bacterium]|jgi:DcuC family C4-dicarboxylate transporter|nr:C4-dicarboxylate ABC transporter [Porphyromonadaceae bacterium]HBK32950.1 C4-dicarboxylate ABC transporter [Porphyromonadaceae bacterium]HBL33608.1 C4-dicarboxylate ABC transporter [Porphyromonadaceae bacterium]HBX19342.1 C4-dicarboxylate ABC transporter [Porphyromonadaceae bacterium]